MAVETLLVFSDDWGRHPSSCQHLVHRLIPDYDVVWVNTIGTRAPRLNTATLRRALGKLDEWSQRGKLKRKTAEQQTISPDVLCPVMWPWFRRPTDRWINQRLLARAINTAVRPRPAPRVALTTLPIVADLIGWLDVDYWIYYCVDDLAAWPGLDGDALLRMERLLVEKADRIITASVTLRERIRQWGRDSTLLTHGVDLDHWRSTGSTPDLALSTEPSPQIVFWGLLDERLDHDWVTALAERMNEGSILLAGPIESLHEQLKHYPRIQTTGPIDYGQLPAIAASASVLIMPYRDLPATRAMQPLKLKEYLATGLPCVARRLPATVPWADCLDLASTTDEFVDAVLNRAGSGLPNVQVDARKRLANESWDAKADRLRYEIEQTIASNAC